ncbi:MULTISPECIES: hypothetical protein [unclassified Pseudonocardia]|uniref:hypothetical protein n=1 Tax=unclassified Pseudonocardia TaxID=2619320 RepID=UPI0011152563|nr:MULTISPECIES: hypothetical protein [unclassified Pseudonocardia]
MRREQREAAKQLQDRLNEHPGRVEHRKIHALIGTLKQVFEPNYRELVDHIDSIHGDTNAVFDLFENIGRPKSQSATTGRISRNLHNYIASTSTLADHARNFLHDKDDLSAEFATRRAELVTHPEITFISRLRNFALHRSLPVIQYTLAFKQELTKPEIELSTADLLEDDSWSATTRKFISSHGQRMPLRPIVDHHFSLVYNLNAWLINTAQERNRPALAEANELIIELNMAKAGVDRERAIELSKDSTRRVSPVRRSEDA